MNWTSWLNKIAIFLMCVIISFAVNSSYAADSNLATSDSLNKNYELGDGYRLGDSGFTLGGYSSLQLEDLQSTEVKTSLSHLSLFIWWEGNSPFKFFTEIDSQHLLSADEQSDHREGRYFSIERLYLEYTLSDKLVLRAGKFLTPIGRWNQIHADPLVWTTSRPLITVNLFPDHFTGGVASGNVDIFGHQADYILYTSVGTDVKADPTENPFNEAVGGRLNIAATRNLQIGLSLASFDQASSKEEHELLIGSDFIWKIGKIALSSEAAFRKSSYGGKNNAWGGFFQGVIPLHGKLFGIARIESMHNPLLQQDTKLIVTGLNYQHSRAISLKAELIHGIRQDISSAGFLSSVSVLF